MKIGDEKTQYRSDNMSFDLPHESIRKSLRGDESGKFRNQTGYSLLWWHNLYG